MPRFRSILVFTTCVVLGVLPWAVYVAVSLAFPTSLLPHRFDDSAESSDEAEESRRMLVLSVTTHSLQSVFMLLLAAVELWVFWSVHAALVASVAAVRHFDSQDSVARREGAGAGAGMLSARRRFRMSGIGMFGSFPPAAPGPLSAPSTIGAGAGGGGGAAAANDLRSISARRGAGSIFGSPLQHASGGDGGAALQLRPAVRNITRL
jgi:hypothetical protein